MLTVDTPATTYDLTVLESVKEELGIKTNDRDARLRSLIRRASGIVADHCRRVFAKETVTETLRLVDRPHIALQRFPVSSVTSVTADGSALGATLYEVDAKRGLLYRLSGTTRIAWCYDEVVVKYTGGFALVTDLPHGVEAAAIEVVKSLYFGGTRDPNVRSVEVPGVISKSYAANADPMPPLAAEYLEPHVRHDAMFDD